MVMVKNPTGILVGRGRQYKYERDTQIAWGYDGCILPRGHISLYPKTHKNDNDNATGMISHRRGVCKEQGRRYGRRLSSRHAEVHGAMIHCIPPLVLKAHVPDHNVCKEKTLNLPLGVCVQGKSIRRKRCVYRWYNNGHQHVEACITEWSIVQP